MNREPADLQSEIPRKTDVFTIENTELRYPTIFRSGCTGMGVFTVNATRAQALIADSGFKIARVRPGRALMNLVCVHYTDTDCGSYNEIALNFAVKTRGALNLPYASTWAGLINGDIATYTWRLPVSSQLAKECGIQMWGLPKTKEDIQFSQDGGYANWQWLNKGKEVLSFTIPCSGDRQPKAIEPPVYSVINGKPVVAYLHQQYGDVGYHRNAKLHLGEHHFADTLRDLGIKDSPMIGVWNGKLFFEMSEPVAL